MTYNWYKGESAPIPNNHNPRKCRNWQKVHQWAKDHQAPAPKAGLQRLPGFVEYIPPWLPKEQGGSGEGGLRPTVPGQMKHEEGKDGETGKRAS